MITSVFWRMGVLMGSNLAVSLIRQRVPAAVRLPRCHEAAKHRQIDGRGPGRVRRHRRVVVVLDFHVFEVEAPWIVRIGNLCTERRILAGDQWVGGAQKVALRLPRVLETAL